MTNSTLPSLGAWLAQLGVAPTGSANTASGSFGTLPGTFALTLAQFEADGTTTQAMTVPQASPALATATESPFSNPMQPPVDAPREDAPTTMVSGDPAAAAAVGTPWMVPSQVQTVEIPATTVSPEANVSAHDLFGASAPTSAPENLGHASSGRPMGSFDATPRQSIEALTSTPSGPKTSIPVSATASLPVAPVLRTLALFPSPPQVSIPEQTVLGGEATRLAASMAASTSSSGPGATMAESSLMAPKPGTDPLPMASVPAPISGTEDKPVTSVWAASAPRPQAPVTMDVQPIIPEKGLTPALQPVTPPASPPTPTPVPLTPAENATAHAAPTDTSTAAPTRSVGAIETVPEAVRTGVPLRSAESLTFEGSPVRVATQTPASQAPVEQARPELPRSFADLTQRPAPVATPEATAPRVPTPVAEADAAKPISIPTVEATPIVRAATVGLTTAGPDIPVPAKPTIEAVPAQGRPAVTLFTTSHETISTANPGGSAPDPGQRDSRREPSHPAPAPVEASPAPSTATAPTAPAPTVDASAAAKANPIALEAQISKAVAEIAERGEGDRLLAAARSEATTARVQLRPVHLGELDITVARREDGRLEVILRAAQESTQRTLEREVDRLVQTMLKQDLDVHQVQVRSLPTEGLGQSDDSRGSKLAREQADTSQRDARDKTERDADSRSGGRRPRRHSGYFDAEA